MNMTRKMKHVCHFIYSFIYSCLLFTPVLSQNYLEVIHHVEFGDIDGDYDDDFIIFRPGGFHYVKVENLQFDKPSNEYQFYTAHNGWEDFDKHPRFLGDFNGDNKADIIGFGNYHVAVSISDGFEFSKPESKTTDFTIASGFANFKEFPRLIGDVNGDNKSDIVGFSTGVLVSLSDGVSFLKYKEWLSGKFDRNSEWLDNYKMPRFIADVNGDNYDDIVGIHSSEGVFVAISDPKRERFKKPEIWLKGEFNVNKKYTDIINYPRMLKDVNGDEIADIIGFGEGKIEVSLSRGKLVNGQGFDDPISWFENGYDKKNGWKDMATFPRFIADVNGDWIGDIVGFGSGEILVSHSLKMKFSNPYYYLTQPYTDKIKWWPDIIKPKKPRYFDKEIKFIKEVIDDIVKTPEKYGWEKENEDGRHVGNDYLETRTICKHNKSVPKGWIIVDHIGRSKGFNCGDQENLNDGIWYDDCHYFLIQNYKKLPKGWRLEVCIDVKTPDGWKKVDEIKDSQRCCAQLGDILGDTNNMKIIEKIIM